MVNKRERSDSAIAESRVSFLGWSIPTRKLELLCVILLSAAAGFVLHHSALSAGWRYDDGPHLLFAASHSPWQYFFMPEVMRQQSWANITPWNPFFYDIGLPVFGLNPFGHYAHLLIVICATAFCTFLLLRIWLPFIQSVLAAGLFLVMPSTGAIGQMLMTGHYAYGLLFTVLAIYFFVLGLRHQKYFYALLAGIFYLLACWCKELYVPMIGVLCLLPISTFRTRVFYAAPCLMVACFYTVYRLVVFSGLGGYGAQVQRGGFSLLEVLQEFVTTLLGEIWIFPVLVVYLLLGINWRGSHNLRGVNLLFLSGCFFIALFPLIVMMTSGDVGTSLNIRVFYFISWGVSVLVAWMLRNSLRQGVPLLVLLCALIFSQDDAISSIQRESAAMEAENEFLVAGDSEKLLLPMHFRLTSYLTDMREAVKLISGTQSPMALQTEEDIASLGVTRGALAYQYNQGCQCVTEIGEDRYRDRVATFRSGLLKGGGREMAVNFEVQNGGFRKRLIWNLSGPEGQYIFHVRGYTAFELPPAGELNFAASGFLKDKNTVHIFVHLHTPDGAIMRTPLLELDLNRDSQLGWAGKSAVEW